MNHRLVAGAVLVWLTAAGVPGGAEETGRQLLDKARTAVASAPTLRRTDTVEQVVCLINGPQRMEQKPTTSVVTIEVDLAKMLARQMSTVQGKQLIMLRQGNNAAMKLGKGVWETPRGPFQNAAQELGNLFVCEIETPEDKQFAPDWKVTGSEVVDGQDAYIVESAGNTAAALAEARMTKAIAKNFAGNPDGRPTVKVLAYVSRHWISKADFRRLRAVQTSKVQISTKGTADHEQVIEQSSTSSSSYEYGPVNIEVPDDAQKILSAPPAAPGEPNN
jgi:hypothetical protein